MGGHEIDGVRGAGYGRLILYCDGDGRYRCLLRDAPRRNDVGRRET